MSSIPPEDDRTDWLIKIVGKMNKRHHGLDGIQMEIVQKIIRACESICSIDQKSSSEKASKASLAARQCGFTANPESESSESLLG